MIQQTVSQPSALASDSTASATQNALHYVPAGTGATYRSPVDVVRILITGEQNGGAFFLAEVVVAPGAGNPPHIHSREEETFYMQEGTLTVQVGENTLTATAGDFLCLPRGIPHCFQNSGNVAAKFLLLAVPAGLEKFFEEAFYAAEECPEAPPMTEAFMGRVLTAASKCGLEFLPPA